MAAISAGEMPSLPGGVNAYVVLFWPMMNTIKPISVLKELKEATWPYHERLEKNMNLLSPGFSRTDYLRLIKAFWGYYGPLEARIAGVAELKAWLPDLDRRTKLTLLESDLRALGIDAEALARLPICREIPDCTHPAAAFGCLYVLEGATLGGQVIIRHLHNALNLDAHNGAAFFTGYGEATGAMWQTFRLQLTAAGLDKTMQIRSACETFMTLERWLKQNGCHAKLISDVTHRAVESQCCSPDGAPRA